MRVWLVEELSTGEVVVASTVGEVVGCGTVVVGGGTVESSTGGVSCGGDVVVCVLWWVVLVVGVSGLAC